MMGDTFFTSWQTWEKLTFILACALLVTVLLGFIKLAYIQRRLRKYEVGEKERIDGNVRRRWSLRDRQPQDQSRGETPFGIRALERGIEVEGVWISPKITPQVPTRASSAASSVRGHFELENQDVAWNQLSFLPTHRPGKVPSENKAIKVAVVPGSATIANIGDTLQKPAHSSKPARYQFPPLSYARYDGNPYVLRRHSSTTSTLEGLEAIHRASTSINGQAGGHSFSSSSDSSNQSTDGANDVGPISASAPHLFTVQPGPRTSRESSIDLSLLNSHRLSQAAEVGQLTPRGRRQGKSRSLDSSRPAEPSRSMPHTGYSSLVGPTEASSRSTRHPHNSASTSKSDALTAAIRRASMPDVTPFTQFCARAPTSPQTVHHGRASLETSRPASLSTEPPDSSAPQSPPIPSSAGTLELTLDPAPPSSAAAAVKRSSFEKCALPVVGRGHGTGFEVLPGSVGPPRYQQFSAPPVSLWNAARAAAGEGGEEREKVPGRKLQKRRRSE